MKPFFKQLIVACILFWASISNAAVLSGNPNGDITMIFVYDYQCPYCHEMYPVIQQLETQFPNLKVRMMPIVLWTSDQTRNTISLHEAHAAIAATNTNQFWDFTNQVMAQAPMTDDQVTALLNQMGLNTQQFQDTMHSQAVEAQLMQGQTQMHDSGHEFVPLFIIYPSVLDPRHGITVGGKQSLQTMIAAIQSVQQKMQQAAQQEQAAELAQQAGLSQS